MLVLRLGIFTIMQLFVLCLCSHEINDVIHVHNISVLSPSRFCCFANENVFLDVFKSSRHDNKPMKVKSIERQVEK